MNDEIYMQRCLQLAANGIQGARPNPMVGAVIVADGRILGEGYHVRCGKEHAEVNAFANVRHEDEELIIEATLYVSLEPCSHYGKTPPCADLIINKGVRRVVVGCVDPFAEVQGRGIQKLRDAGIEVTVGVLERECQWLNRRFFTYHREHRPFIILKWAQTVNGFIDDEGKALQISNKQTQMLSHQLRAEEDAILVGIPLMPVNIPVLTFATGMVPILSVWCLPVSVLCRSSLPTFTTRGSSRLSSKVVFRPSSRSSMPPSGTKSASRLLPSPLTTAPQLPTCPLMSCFIV